jgi:pimeloyl-ACP methyl ester carboxylesterase
MVPQSGLQALSGVRYECYTSADGNALLTAQAGVQHEQTVLLIHGLGTSGHHDWRETLPVLAQRYHVLAIDLPGFGGSPSLPQGYQFDALARLLRQLLQHYAVGPAIVIGHSLGGAIALDFAHRHPQLLERLILVDVAGVLQKQVFANHIAQWPLPQQIGLPPLDRVLGQLGRHIDLVKRNVLNWPEQFFDLTGFLRDNPGLRSLILRDQVMVDAAIGLVEADFSAAIRQTQTATFILWGSDDTITPVRTGRLLAHRMPNARLYLVPGARHVPMLEAPGEFHRLLGDALQMPSKLGTPALKAVLPASLEQAPKLQCTQQNGGRYSGAIRRLILDNCHGVRIEDARIGELVLRNANVELTNVEITSTTTAITASQSMLVGTAVTISGQPAVVSDGSRFDLAGATLIGKEDVAEIVSDSIFYLSVSEWQRGDHRQDRHEVLHLPAGRY